MSYFRFHNPRKSVMGIAAAAIMSIVAFSAARAASGYAVAQADEPSGKGTLNSIDAANRKVDITHGPIAALKWPAMTMDFGVAPGVDIKALTPGSKVSFTLRRGADGMYVIDAVKLTH